MEAENASCLYMNFPRIRHWHRYEYVVESGYVNGKRVVDLGCGAATGSFILSAKADFVLAVDSDVSPAQVFAFTDARAERVVILKGDLFDVKAKMDVVIAIEVFEHMPDVNRFIDHMAGICNWAFITTPLAEKTEKTVNPVHVLEYSAEDFDKIVERRFDIIDKVYQHADLSITKEAVPHGSSYDFGHVVQMAWCRRRNG